VKTTLKIKLAPSSEQHAALVETMERFNAACDVIAQVAFEHHLCSKFKLQKLIYHEVRERFGLSAQLVIRAISKVVEAYKRDTSIRCRFKARGAVVYDERILSFRGLEAVNLWTVNGREPIPMVLGQYQRTHIGRAKGQADLVLVGQTFFLLVTLETPEEPETTPNGFLGIDLGIVKIAVDSDGKEASGEGVDAVRSRTLRLRRGLQAHGGKNAKRHLVRLRGREARYRRNENHRIANQIVARAKDTNRGIGLENLRYIRSRTTVRRADRARQSGWAFWQLQAMILYKARLAGVALEIVDPRNSSRECSACGYVSKRNRPSQAVFACQRAGCQHEENADHNAAKVIAGRAEAQYSRHSQLAFDAVHVGVDQSDALELQAPSLAQARVE
jgi:IS605 OrfB family transposase